MAKKAFFREATKAEIARKDFKEVTLLPDISGLASEQFSIIFPLVPRGYENARKFMKHGREVRPKRFYSLKQAVEDGRTPVQLREEAFNAINGHEFCGYTFMPLGRDQRKRKVSLVECLEGARIFAYSHQVHGTQIKVQPYADSARVRRDGAEVVVEVPSREEGADRIQLKLTSVPVVDSPEKYVVSLNMGSDHSCPAKRFNIRYRYSDDKESSGIVNMCAHEIAAYLATVDHFWEERMNVIPLQMSQFVIPSQEMVDYYLRLRNNVLVRDESLKSKDKLRKPDRADTEIALWALVEALKHDRTCYSKRSRDGNVADYKWL